MTDSVTTPPTKHEIAVEAFECEQNLRDWVTAQWFAGNWHGKAVQCGAEPIEYMAESQAYVAGYEAHMQISDGDDVADGFALGSQIRQYEADYRRLQADILIKDSAKASMTPLGSRQANEELDAAMSVMEKYGSWTAEGVYQPMLVRPLAADVDAYMANNRGVSVSDAREVVCKQYVEFAVANKVTTTRIDIRFDLGIDLVAPQIVCHSVPEDSRAWLERGEVAWFHWYLPEVHIGKDGVSRSSWYHRGDWRWFRRGEWVDQDPQDGGDPGTFVPGIAGCVAVFTDPATARRASTELLKAVMTIRRISAEAASQHDQYDDDPVRRVGEDGKPVTTFRRRQHHVL